jgi:hypothetical protein
VTTTDLARNDRAKLISILGHINEMIPSDAATTIELRTDPSNVEVRVHMLTGNAPETAAALGLDLVGAKASTYGEREIHVGWEWVGVFEQDYVEARVQLAAGTFFPVRPVADVSR